MNEKIILEGITIDQLVERIKEVIKPDASTSKVDKLLTRKEAAEYLNISLPTLDKMTKSGILRAYSTGRKKNYNASELQQKFSLK